MIMITVVIELKSEERMKEIVCMLAEELERIALSPRDQEEILAELLEKFGLIELDEETGMLRLSEKGRLIVRAKG